MNESLSIITDKKWELSSQMTPIFRIFHKIVVYLQCITSATVNQIVHSYQTFLKQFIYGIL